MGSHHSTHCSSRAVGPSSASSRAASAHSPGGSRPPHPHQHHSLLCGQQQRENQVSFPAARGAPPSRHLGDLLQPVSPPKGFLFLLWQPEPFSRIPFFEIRDAGQCGPWKPRGLPISTSHASGALRLQHSLHFPSCPQEASRGPYMFSEAPRSECEDTSPPGRLLVVLG